MTSVHSEARDSVSGGGGLRFGESASAVAVASTAVAASVVVPLASTGVLLGDLQ